MATLTAQPKLYQYEACPFCWKVRAGLQYKGIAYETIEVHPLNKKELAFSPDYQKVPVMVGSDGQQVNDSTGILKALDQQYPDKLIFESDEKAQKLETQWIEWADTVLVRSLPPLIYRSLREAVRAFSYITKIGKFGWAQQRIIKYAGGAVMTMVARKSAKGQNITDPVGHFKTCLKQWEQALSNNSFLGGKKPNGADISVYGYLKSIEQLPAFQYVRANKSVCEWYQRTEQQCV
jgi:microsomal prostaglandin-E synthase 2